MIHANADIATMLAVAMLRVSADRFLMEPLTLVHSDHQGLVSSSQCVMNIEAFHTVHTFTGFEFFISRNPKSSKCKQNKTKQNYFYQHFVSK